MFKNMFFLLVVSLFMTSLVHGAKIIWVADNLHYDFEAGLPADHGFVELLRSQGYEVDYKGEIDPHVEGNDEEPNNPDWLYWRELDVDKIAELNAADLVIIARDPASSTYDDDDEPLEWNSVTTPMIMQSAHISRAFPKWGWFNTTATTYSTERNAVVINAGHPIFEGVDIDPDTQMVEVLSNGWNVDWPDTTDVGNGALLATRPDGVVWIAEWEARQEYFEDSGQFAGGHRMFFASGSGSKNSIGDGTYNLTADGQTMFLNAVSYMIGSKVPKGCANDPEPRNGKENVPRDNTVLGWTPGAFAQTHNVYFGTDFNDVNEADASSPLLVGPGQSATSYELGRLEYGKTCYWRIDEVNAPPDDTVFKGIIWSFTVELYAYPIPGESITVSASSQAEGQEAENTINESGLVEDLHSIVTTDMWATLEGEALPAWIQYEFDKSYKLHEMLVWNYNGESFLSTVGLKDVIVEHSMDGINWTQLTDVTEFAQAIGKENYAADTTVPFGDVKVKFVKITATTNWSGGFANQYGLSEVRFLYVPVSAQNPDPENGSESVSLGTHLFWQAGREVSEHKLYISSDQQAVIDRTVPVITLSQAGYGPLSLDLGTTYYWRVDEVNNANVTPIWEGEIWSFTTNEIIVVEDFESYNEILPPEDPGSNLVYITWIDGYDNPSANGSTIGYTEGNSLERVIVHGGAKAAPLMYDNSTAPFSEVSVDPAKLAIGRDWTTGSPQSLVIWFYGDPENSVTDRMYAKINNNKVNYSGDATDLSVAEWQPFNVNLTGISLNNVTSFSIGLEKTGTTGGSGTLIIDDIVLSGLGLDFN